MKTLLLLIVSACMASTVLAQFQIEGKVVDSQNNPLPGASVIVNKTTTGTVTDDDGFFVLHNLKKGKITLSASFIGYLEKNINLNVQQNEVITIQLEEQTVLTEEVFVYATRAGNKTPMAVSTITRDELASRNMGQDIPFLMQTTPSLVASSDAGTGIGYTNFRIRGTDANRINVTINGIPVNDAESHGVFWVNMPDFSSSVENMQVQRGVGTSTHGAGAFGATINMQTSTLQKKPYAQYSGAAGSFNTTKNTIQIGSGLLNNHFSFDARLSKIDTDGFIDRAYSHLQSYFVSGGYYAENTIAKINIFSGNEKTYQAWSGVPSDSLKTNRTYNPYTYDNETDNYKQDHYQLLISHNYSPKTSLNMAAHYTRGLGYYEQYKTNDELSKYDLAPISIGDTILTSSDNIRQKWLDNHFYGGIISFIYQGTKSHITLGGGWNQYIGHHYGNILWLANNNGIEKDFEWYRNTGVKTDMSGFIKYDYSITEKLSLYADLQYRNIDFEIDGIDDDLRDISQPHNFSFFNPKFGIYYKISDQHKIWASWAVANREPNRSNYTDAPIDGPLPQPEKLNDFETGYEYIGKNLQININGYYMLYDNQLILTGLINDVGSAIMTNVKDSYRAGIELSTKINILKNLTWEANTTLSQNKILNFTEYVDDWDNGGQIKFEHGTTDIAFSPALIANSNISFSANKSLTLSLVSHYVSDQYIDNSSSQNRKLDAYFVNNFKAGYALYPDFVDKIEISLQINNLLNAQYETNAWVYSYILGGNRYKTDGYFPQAGTNFMFGINIDF